MAEKKAAEAPKAAESPTGDPTKDAVLILANLIEGMMAGAPSLHTQDAATKLAAAKALVLPPAAQ